jgi:hypothetical protein
MVQKHAEGAAQERQVIEDGHELSIEWLDRVAAGNRDKDPWPDPPATGEPAMPLSVSK